MPRCPGRAQLSRPPLPRKATPCILTGSLLLQALPWSPGWPVQGDPKTPLLPASGLLSVFPGGFSSSDRTGYLAYPLCWPPPPVHSAVSRPGEPRLALRQVHCPQTQLPRLSCPSCLGGASLVTCLLGPRSRANTGRFIGPSPGPHRFLLPSLCFAWFGCVPSSPAPPRTGLARVSDAQHVGSCTAAALVCSAPCAPATPPGFLQKGPDCRGSTWWRMPRSTWPSELSC